MTADQFLIDHGGVRRSERLLLQDRSHCLHDIPAAAVIRADGELHRAAVLGRPLGFLDRLSQGIREGRDVTRHMKTDIVLYELFPLVHQHQPEEPHEGAHFLLRALPVFAAESEKRQRLDSGASRGFGTAFHRGNSSPVAFDSRHMAVFRPSAVSVHDDGNMPRESFHRFSFLHQFSSHAAIRRS